MKRRAPATTNATATAPSRYVPRCAKICTLVALLSTGCLNPWPDDFPSNGEAVSLEDVGQSPPSFSGIGGSGPAVAPQPSDLDFWNDDREPNDPTEMNGASPGTEAPDAGAPPPDGGLSTGIRRLRSLRDGGADAE